MATSLDPPPPRGDRREHGKNECDTQQQFLCMLNRTRGPRRRGLCLFEKDGRLPNSGRCWLGTA
eukprot:8569414-Pyramimonas_sp.AAC.1